MSSLFCHYNTTRLPGVRLIVPQIFETLSTVISNFQDVKDTQKTITAHCPISKTYIQDYGVWMNDGMFTFVSLSATSFNEYSPVEEAFPIGNI